MVVGLIRLWFRITKGKSFFKLENPDVCIDCGSATNYEWMGRLSEDGEMWGPMDYVCTKCGLAQSSALGWEMWLTNNEFLGHGGIPQYMDKSGWTTKDGKIWSKFKFKD